MQQSTNLPALLRLMTWMSPAFPVGAFSYSMGLEKAVEDGLIHDSAELAEWLSALLEYGSFWNDAVLLVYSAREYSDSTNLDSVSSLGLALAGSKERYRETLLLGQAFCDAAKAWPCDALDLLPEDVPYPVAVGAVSAAHDIALADTLAAYLHASISQMVSAGIRLGVIGQRQSLSILAELEPSIQSVTLRAFESSLDDLGTCAINADIAALRHETQRTRLFRS